MFEGLLGAGATTTSSNLIRTGLQAAPAQPGGSVYETLHVLGALLLVVGAIFLCRWLARRFFNLPGATRASDAIKVLSRTPIANRQHVLLLEVGHRVLVVADSGQQLSTLCQITDADEIRMLTRGPAPQAGLLNADGATPLQEKNFEQVLRREMSRDDMDVEPAETSDGEQPPPREVSNLLQKVRGFSQQFR
ncbi:MAG TPA: flagellar biosynthetic protein FliO [Tepidisphaeraceae bacterium]